MNHEFWKGKTVLVTGHTGFKGAWLALWLTKLGTKMIGYALEPHTPKDVFVRSRLEEHMTSIIGDIRDETTLQKVFSEQQPEIVFHLAAQPYVRYSYTHPKETYQVNVLGTLQVLEAIRQTDNVKAAVLITTDKCYENTGQIWGYRETDHLGGHDPYSSSKACAEVLIASYRDSFFASGGTRPVAIASARAGNVIGGGDWGQDRILPDSIRALEQDVPILVRNPSAIRPWQHVLEPLQGYLLLAQKLYEDRLENSTRATLETPSGDPSRFSGAWNFGPENDGTATVLEMVHAVIKAYGSGSVELAHNPAAPHEAQRLTLDITKARELLDWKPRLNFAQTVSFTVDWYKRYRSEDVYKLCLEQIERYQKMPSRGISA